MEKKSTLQFLWPYVIGILAYRLVIDTAIKHFELGYQGEFCGQIISFIIMMASIFICINNYKTAHNNQLKFVEGIKIGVGLILIVGVIFTLYLSLIHAKLIDPTYQERLVEEASKQLLAQNPDADISKLKNNKPNSIGIGIAISIVKYIFIGVLGGVISSAILKTEK